MAKKTTEFNLFRTFKEECTADDFRQIVKQAVADAKTGDAAARLFVAAYVIGTPKNCSLTLSGLDNAEASSAETEQLLAGLHRPARR